MNRLSPRARAFLALAVVVIAVNALVAALDRLTSGSQPSGPASSSLATASGGYEAWADLLAQQGHPVDRLRSPLDRSPPPAGSTVVVADPTSLSTAEMTALASFLRGGGRVIALGVRTVPLLRTVLGDGAPRWGPAAITEATPAGAAAETAGVGAVVTSGTGGSFEDAGSAEVLLSGQGLVLAAAAGVGNGRLVMFADSSVFSNAALGSADNALLALDVVGSAHSTVAFDEVAHGFGTGAGLGGLPVRWQWALVLAALAAGLWMWSRGRRFGPPERLARSLPPPRRRYVEAMGTSLAAVRPADAAAVPVRRAARSLLAARARLGDEVDEGSLAAAAALAGTPPAVTAAVLASGQTEDEVLAAGRALAWLEEARDRN